MKPSEQFKQAIREGKIQEAFAIAMGNAPQLQIKTWIADAQAEPNPETSQPQNSSCLRTHVNLVEGEILNEIGQSTIDDELYPTLQQFHLDRVSNSHQTVSENLQSLQQMFRLLTLLQKQQLGESVPSLERWHISNTLASPSVPDGEVLSKSLNPSSLDISGLDANSLHPSSFNHSFLPPDSLLVEEAEEDYDNFSDDSEDMTMLDDLLTLDELDIEPEIEPEPEIESEIKPESNPVAEPGAEPSAEFSFEQNIDSEFGVNQPAPSIQPANSAEDDWGDLLDEAGLNEREKSSLKMFDLEQIDFDLTDDER